MLYQPFDGDVYVYQPFFDDGVCFINHLLVLVNAKSTIRWCWLMLNQPLVGNGLCFINHSMVLVYACFINHSMVSVYVCFINHSMVLVNALSIIRWKWFFLIDHLTMMVYALSTFC